MREDDRQILTENSEELIEESSGDVIDGHINRDHLTDTHDQELAKKYAKTSFFQKFIVEVCQAFFIFSVCISSIPKTDIYMKKACLYNLGYSAQICFNLSDHETQKTEVQKVTKFYTMGEEIISTVGGTIAAITVGQYMSKYGLKPPMVLCMTGTLISTVLQSYTLFVHSVPLYFSLLATIPGALTGGLLVLMTAVFTNITNSCPSEARKRRFLLIQFFFFMPVTLSTAFGSPIYMAFGFLPLAVLSVVTLLIAFAVIYFFYKDMESFEEARKTDSFGERMTHSTNLTTLKLSCSYLFKKRPAHGRAQLLLMIFCMIIGFIGFSGTNDLNYLYVNLLYKWDPSQYSNMSTLVLTAVFILSIPTMLFFTKVWKLRDPLMGALGFSCYAMKYFISSMMSFGEYMYFVQSFVGVPFIVSLTAIRSHLTRLLMAHETPVIFALTGALEKIIPIGSDLVVTFIYNSTIETFPGAVFIVLGLLFLLPVLAAVMTSVLMTRHGLPHYSQEEEATSKAHFMESSRSERR